jgi:hypothetical protein
VLVVLETGTGSRVATSTGCAWDGVSTVTDSLTVDSDLFLFLFKKLNTVIINVVNLWPLLVGIV